MKTTIGVGAVNHHLKEIYTESALVPEATALTVQNKTHWAAHGHAAAEIVHERADGDRPSWACRPRGPAA